MHHFIKYAKRSYNIFIPVLRRLHLVEILIDLYLNRVFIVFFLISTYYLFISFLGFFIGYVLSILVHQILVLEDVF